MLITKLNLLTILMISALLAGCNALPAQKMVALSVEEKTPQSSPTPIALTPLSVYEDEWANEAADGASFSDAYTRLLIYSDLPADGGKQDEGDARTLPYSPRWWWLRALLGKEFSINLTTKVTVGHFETTVPLATVGHQSNSDGEQWNRVVHHSKINFPLFLVKADGSASVPTVKLSVSGTKSYSSRGAAAAVQVALGVARATGQPASVITRLTEQSTKDRARAIDDAISTLFKSGIAEEHWTDRDLRLWRTGSQKRRLPGVKVTFKIPEDEQNWNSTPMTVGTWTITFDYPRPSIFSDWRICKAEILPRCGGNRSQAKAEILKEVNASEVLNYVLANGNHGLGTIRAFMSQQDWYIAAQTALTNQATRESVAASLCKRIANEIAGLGLNGFDARIAAWAVTHGMPLPTGVSRFPDVNECKLPKSQ